LGQLEPDGDRCKRINRLKDVLETQKTLGVSKIAGTDRMPKHLLQSQNTSKHNDTAVGEANSRGGPAAGRESKDANTNSLVPYSSDSDDNGQKESEVHENVAKASHELPRKQAKVESSPAPSSKAKLRGMKQKQKQKQRPMKKPEKSLVEKLLSDTIRKERSHILQCFRFLVKTDFQMLHTAQTHSEL